MLQDVPTQDAIHKPTFGEKQVGQLLSKLPKKEFFYRYEPQLNTQSGNSSIPDFIVVSARLGVVVIEVKDWVQLTGGDQEQIDIVRKDGTPQSFPNPVRVAQRYAYDLNERFEQRADLWERHKKANRLKFPWQVMVVLPHISQRVIHQFEENGIWPQNVVIGRESLKNPELFEQAIRSLPWKFELKQPLSLDMLDLAREVIDPHLVVQDADGNPIGTITRQQEKLIDEPVSILTLQQMSLPTEDGDTKPAEDTEHEIRLVRGVAGSGKTLVLVRRARRLATEYPDAKILVMSFNVELAADLKKRIALPEDMIDVINFHKLCARILDKAWRSPLRKLDWLEANAGSEIAQLGIPAEFVADELAWRAERGVMNDADYLAADRKGRGYRLEQNKRQLLNQIFNRYQAFKLTQKRQGKVWFDWDDVPFVVADALKTHPLRGQYHAILIDEAQDFAPSWIQVVKLLLKPGGAIFLCDDPSQSIFHAYSWAQKDLNVTGRRSIKLTVPFRSTREISQAAHSLIDADENLRQTEDRPEPDFRSYELGSGPQPALWKCVDERDELMQITQAVHQLIDQGVPGRQIAILCQHKGQTRRWAHLEGLDVYVNYFEKMKGLEFNVVFVPHLQEAFLPTDDQETISIKRRKLFTAMTRARYQLTLTCQHDLPGPISPILNYVQSEVIFDH